MEDYSGVSSGIDVIFFAHIHAVRRSPDYRRKPNILPNIHVFATTKELCIIIIRSIYIASCNEQVTLEHSVAMQ